jgi:hypothetical protein
MSREPIETTIAFIDGPRAGERELIVGSAPEVYDSEVLLNQFDGYPLAPGDPDVPSHWQMHRYRLAASSWFGPQDGGVALYQHVGSLEETE